MAGKKNGMKFDSAEKILIGSLANMIKEAIAAAKNPELSEEIKNAAESTGATMTEVCSGVIRSALHRQGIGKDEKARKNIVEMTFIILLAEAFAGEVEFTFESVKNKLESMIERFSGNFSTTEAEQRSIEKANMIRFGVTEGENDLDVEEIGEIAMDMVEKGEEVRISGNLRITIVTQDEEGFSVKVESKVVKPKNQNNSDKSKTVDGLLSGLWEEVDPDG